ncbi:hypothetical protein Bpfe_000469 [Biomphalaria pfeifferi]|uniref:Uncharacterized protein n=1 Tax=Biomphalaria pfeifferi TaxID=112525 RepID=A0AAD8CCJ7_BIOPF|nr:hypothetical protein Bpfe_000469 [Biomphalaria pfeifferi]
MPTLEVKNKRGWSKNTLWYDAQNVVERYDAQNVVEWYDAHNVVERYDAQNVVERYDAQNAMTKKEIEIEKEFGIY